MRTISNLLRTYFVLTEIAQIFTIKSISFAKKLEKFCGFKIAQIYYLYEYNH